jgi:hypothetical protein
MHADMVASQCDGHCMQQYAIGTWLYGCRQAVAPNQEKVMAFRPVSYSFPRYFLAAGKYAGIDRGDLVTGWEKEGFTSSNNSRHADLNMGKAVRFKSVSAELSMSKLAIKMLLPMQII